MLQVACRRDLQTGEICSSSKLGCRPAALQDQLPKDGAAHVRIERGVQDLLPGQRVGFPVAARHLGKQNSLRSLSRWDCRC